MGRNRTDSHPQHPWDAHLLSSRQNGKSSQTMNEPESHYMVGPTRDQVMESQDGTANGVGFHFSVGIIEGCCVQLLFGK